MERILTKSTIVALMVAVCCVGAQAAVVFEAGFDGTLNASVGVNTAATSSGTITYAAGIKGQAIDLDAGAWVTFAAANMPKVAGSVELWYKTSSTAGRQTLFHARQYDLGGDGLYMAIHDASQIRTTSQRYAEAPTDHWSNVTAEWVDGNWHQVVYTWDQNQTWLGSLYVDGVKKHSYTWNGSNVPAIWGNMYVGSRPGGAWACGGLIDELVVYNTALTDTEVAARYASVPEPATMSLTALGGILALIRRKRS